jgi:hypothetical protein
VTKYTNGKTGRLRTLEEINTDTIGYWFRRFCFARTMFVWACGVIILLLAVIAVLLWRIV